MAGQKRKRTTKAVVEREEDLESSQLGPVQDMALNATVSRTIYRSQGRYRTVANVIGGRVYRSIVNPAASGSDSLNATTTSSTASDSNTNQDIPTHLHDHSSEVDPTGDVSNSTPSPRLQKWASEERQYYVNEFHRLDGRCGYRSCFTTHQSQTDGTYRCLDCFGTELYCQVCILERHRNLPLHRIQEWKHTHFSSISLKSLGMTIQLGHDGDECPFPGERRDDFCIVDTSGIHMVDVRFCNCGFATEDIQLLRKRWYPATSSRPRTAFTFDVLNTFHLLTLQGKISAYDFYLAIERKTDNTGVSEIQSRYNQFLLCMREFRHIRMLRRAGRGVDPLGVSATKPGACAVECPACPQPGMNLPVDWATAPDRWKYGLILTIDANFRLKNKDRNMKHDAPLGDGWGHWVPEAPYMEYITLHNEESEPNLCDSELRAVDHANKRRSKGYVSTGVAGVVCARHGLVRRNGLGNLQKGERYANTDFVVFYSLKGVTFSRLVLSYDICCQWSRNLKGRISNLPDDMRMNEELQEQLVFVIPKFHLYGHGMKCQISYSLNYLPWSAETDGEDPERWWSHINPVSMSTKLMGPGSRHDTIDDHAAAWNWMKITGFGTSLLQRFRESTLMRARHLALHDEYTSEFKPEDVERWQAMVKAWEADPSTLNPFEEKETTSTIAEVRLELAREEMENPTTRTTSTGPNEFLYKGLELEETQYVTQHTCKGNLKMADSASLAEGESKDMNKTNYNT